MKERLVRLGGVALGVLVFGGLLVMVIGLALGLCLDIAGYKTGDRMFIVPAIGMGMVVTGLTFAGLAALACALQWAFEPLKVIVKRSITRKPKPPRSGTSTGLYD